MTTPVENNMVYQPDDKNVSILGCEVNNHLASLIYSSLLEVNQEDDEMDEEQEKHENNSRTELDSHANMLVVGRNVVILSDTGRTTQVSTFTLEYKSLQGIKIVDVALQYVCPLSHTY